MQRTLANVTSSILATEPLSDNLIKTLMPTGVAAADGNTALNYYRIDAQNRLIFGGRASYLIPDDPAVIGTDLRRRMLSVFPELETVEIAHIWSGRIGITVRACQNLAHWDAAAILCKASLVMVWHCLGWLAKS